MKQHKLCHCIFLALSLSRPVGSSSSVAYSLTLFRKIPTCLLNQISIKTCTPYPVSQPTKTKTKHQRS